MKMLLPKSCMIDSLIVCSLGEIMNSNKMKYAHYISKTYIGLLIDLRQHQAVPKGLKTSTCGNKIMTDCQNCCYHYYRARLR